MEFNAKVRLKDSPEATKQMNETKRIKALLLEVVNTLTHKDVDTLSEAEAFLKGVEK